MNVIERAIEGLFFSSRWLMAPFLLGLVAALLGLLYRFSIGLFNFVLQLKNADSNDMIVGILSLIDLTLIANLILIVICSSYENFVRPVNAADHPDWPGGLMRKSSPGWSAYCSSSPSPCCFWPSPTASARGRA